MRHSRIRLPPRVFDGEALLRPGMKEARLGEPGGGQLVHPIPREADARRFGDAMRERLREFALSLHPDKTRLLAFGRFAAARRARCGLRKAETLDFLGVNHI